jgi:NO-binding membrane sensor protein with MHYT domain
MNASKPALAALIIGMIISLQGQSNARRLACAVVMGLGIATPASESVRAFTLARHIANDGDISSFVAQFPDFAKQYVTTEKIWFLRPE